MDFFYLNYGFRPSQSTADFATALYDRLATPFNRSRTTPVLALDFAKAFDRFFHAGLLNKAKSYRISSQIFGLFYFFSKVGGFEWFWIGNLHKNTHLMLEFLNIPFLVLYFSYYDVFICFPEDVICNIAICHDDTTLYSECDQPSHLWQQLELAPEPKYHLR